MFQIEIEKRANETPLEHHKRLIYGKLVDKTLSDIDYSELSDEAYGQHYSSDVARRMFYGSKRTLDLISEEGTIDNGRTLSDTGSDEKITEIDDRIIELKKERQKFFDQRREFNKLVNSVARNEHIESCLVESARRLIDSVGFMFKDRGEAPVEAGDDEAVIVLSDWHYGMVADNVFNKFNTEICKKRVKKVVDKAVKRIQLHSCNKLHVIILGDLYHGAIHCGARVASEELVCDQLMQVTEILAQSIEYLSTFVNETHVYMTYGNHARTVQNKNDSIHRDNMERLVPWWLKTRFADYGFINIHEDEGFEFVFADVCGHTFCAVHGDNDSVKTAPRLLGTLFMKKYGRDIDYILLGDKHHRESYEELCIDALMCGSLCGTDDYANDKRLYSTPSQLMLIVNSEEGIDAEYRIKCE